MKVLIRRDQETSGLLRSTIVFAMNVRVEVSDEEEQAISRYRLDDTVLYSNPERGLETVTVGHLMSGRKFVCRDIVEMLGMEEDIKQAAANFKAILHAATQFGGEEVLEV
jgi:hypothetical protein